MKIRKLFYNFTIILILFFSCKTTDISLDENTPIESKIIEPATKITPTEKKTTNKKPSKKTPKLPPKKTIALSKLQQLKKQFSENKNVLKKLTLLAEINKLNNKEAIALNKQIKTLNQKEFNQAIKRQDLILFVLNILDSQPNLNLTSSKITYKSLVNLFNKNSDLKIKILSFKLLYNKGYNQVKSIFKDFNNKKLMKNYLSIIKKNDFTFQNVLIDKFKNFDNKNKIQLLNILSEAKFPSQIFTYGLKSKNKQLLETTLKALPYLVNQKDLNLLFSLLLLDKDKNKSLAYKKAIARLLKENKNYELLKNQNFSKSTQKINEEILKLINSKKL